MAEQSERVIEYFNNYGLTCTEDKAFCYKTEKCFYIREYMNALMKKGVTVLAKNKSTYKFKKVGPKTFKMYMKYLTSDLDSWYNMASRNPRD